MREIGPLRMTMEREPAYVRLHRHESIAGDRVTMRGQLVDTGHGVTIVAEYDGERWFVAHAGFDAPEGGKVTSEVLGVAVEQAMERFMENVSALYIPPDGSKAALDQDSLIERRDEFRRQQRHRRLTDAFLRRVAEIHRRAVKDGEPAMGAVAMEFPNDDGTVVSYDTAARWVREARRRGFLEHSERSRPEE